ncbi:hypothetical protein [Mesorhizobium sp. WSM3626]|uniref:hypothetical protein n=1 Tax=Mesorhizobium sp. WSM3626 TaxID=1040987 RepID=UPI0004B97729|nr:hypothetical protein [Mesorhizobium sp. WSM3626]
MEQLGRREGPYETLVDTRLQELDMLRFSAGMNQRHTGEGAQQGILLQPSALCRHLVVWPTVQQHSLDWPVGDDCQHVIDAGGQHAGEAIDLEDVAKEKIEVRILRADRNQWFHRAAQSFAAIQGDFADRIRRAGRQNGRSGQ